MSNTGNADQRSNRKAEVSDTPEAFALDVDVRDETPSDREERINPLRGRVYGDEVKRLETVLKKNECGVKHLRLQVRLPET